MGDNVIMSGYAGVAGHVEIGDYAIVSGAAIVHQFVRIGEHSRVGGGARVSQDVPPYMITEGHPAIVRAINTIGLQRRGFAEEDIRALKLCYRKLFLHKDTIISEAIETLLADEQYGKNPCLLKLIDFLQTSKRGFGH
jgi:UDP-N-acetylglucosamine acyltransferase